MLGRIRGELRWRGVAEPRHELLMKLQACTRKAVPGAIELLAATKVAQVTAAGHEQ